MEYRTHPGYMGAAQDPLLPLPPRPPRPDRRPCSQKAMPRPWKSAQSTAGHWTGLCRGHRATVQSLQRQKSAFPTPDRVPGPRSRCPGPAASGLCPGCGLTPGPPPPCSSEAQLLRMPARPAHRGRPSSLPSAPSACAPSPVTLSLSPQCLPCWGPPRVQWAQTPRSCLRRRQPRGSSAVPRLPAPRLPS